MTDTRSITFAVPATFALETSGAGPEFFVVKGQIDLGERAQFRGGVDVVAPHAFAGVPLDSDLHLHWLGGSQPVCVAHTRLTGAPTLEVQLSEGRMRIWARPDAVAASRALRCALENGTYVALLTCEVSDEAEQFDTEASGCPARTITRVARLRTVTIASWAAARSHADGASVDDCPPSPDPVPSPFDVQLTGKRYPRLRRVYPDA